MESFGRTRSIIAISALVAAVAAGSSPAAADVSVTLNGQTVPLSPPPITRAGRVFVPLRGIFERLGATVVYQSGQINATGNGRTIGLTIGSNNAVVNGQQEQLDVAPFVIGASTYVPLRFVSQALGAGVNYDGANQIVALSSANGGGDRDRDRQGQPQNNPPQNMPAAAPAAQDGPGIRDLRPARDASVDVSRPAIRAEFDRPVDTGSVHVYLDGRDVSNEAYLNANQVDFTPPFDLPRDRHEVRITGRGQEGAPFERRWAFTVTDAQNGAPQANFIKGLPADGTQVGQSFHVHGTTLPNARIHIVARGAGATLGGIFRVSQGDTYATDVQANGEGTFDADIQVQNQPGGTIVVALQSVAANGQSVSKRVQLQTR